MGKKIVLFSGVTLLVGTIGYIVIDPTVYTKSWSQRSLQRSLGTIFKEASVCDYSTPVHTQVSKPSSTSTAEATISSAEQTNIARKQTIKEYCEKHQKLKPWNQSIALWKKQDVDARPRLYFSDTVKLVFCETPKCGTTQWRNLMLILDGYLKGFEASPDTDYYPLARKHISLWSKFNLKIAADTAVVEDKLQNYFKMMTTREPLERLVSAYRDKLETEKNPFYNKISKKIHMIMTKSSAKNASLATFEEFIDFILTQKARGGLDPHWRGFTELCHPCSIDYDYIARMETVYDDATYITAKLGIDRDKIYNSTGRADAPERREKLFYEYFNKLPTSKRYAVFKYYKDQYDMFGYDYPKFINASLITAG